MLLAAAFLLPQLVGAPPAGAVTAAVPHVDYRIMVASATRKPSVISNGAILEGGAGKRFFYDAPGIAAGVAAAEAFSYGREALVRTDAEGAEAFGRMLIYLRGLPLGPVPLLQDKVKLFGSDVVLAHLSGDGERVRLHLVNYGERPVRALRVMVPGRFAREPAGVSEVDVSAEGMEFSVPEVGEYLVIDLIRAR